MGIYVMSAKALKELLLSRFPTANDFGNEVIPGAKDAGMKVQAYAFKGYWEDIGTVEAFYNANLSLANPATAQFRCVGLLHASGWLVAAAASLVACRGIMCSS
jgi:glucose-1-phosphate adenylyltransferase